MKKFIYVFVITLMAFQTRTSAQNMHLPADSVTTLLCKKWEIDYALIEGKKVDLPPSTPKAYIEFYKDATFSFTSNEPTFIEKGTWEYDTTKGTIFMIVEGKYRKEIISLTKYQFATYSDDPASGPTNSSKISLKAMVYFKIKQ